MLERSERLPRAVGHRVGYAGLPDFVHDWVTSRFGPVQVLRDHVGGMSPGCAMSVRTADGRALFVKAVSMQLNEQTVDLFRYERALLRRLPPAPYRPVLRAALDEGGWVALVLDYVDGRFPDLSAEGDFAAVADAVRTQAAELTPPPDGVDAQPLAVTAQRWATRWDDLRAHPDQFLPEWANARVDELTRRVHELPERLPPTTLCHFDIRDDNLLIRGDGRAVILDWGMARLGPSWTDLVFLAVQKPTAVEAQQVLQRWIPPDAQDVVTSYLVAFGGSQAWNTWQPAKPSLPTLRDFCREDARRLLDLARLRLHP